MNAETSQFELFLPNAVQQFDAGNRDRCIAEPLETEHHGDALLHPPMVLLDQVIQIFRRAQLRLRSELAIGFQLAHRTVRCSVAVERDRLWAATLALLNRFTTECFGGGDVAPGTQSEVDRPAGPINGTIQVAPLAADLDAGLVDPP